MRLSLPSIRLRTLTGRLVRWALVATLALGCAHRLAAHSGDSGLPNVALKTAGGQQLWADLAWEADWRVQRHVFTGHCRLLDPADVRRGWGSEAAMLGALRLRSATGELRAPRSRAVILLHGLWRTRDLMRPMKVAFEDAGYDVLDLGYPSTRAPVASHAAQVAALLERLPHDYDDVSFVTHSLGALVVRQLLADPGAAWRTRHGLGRAVFIAAPNGGAALARVADSIPGVYLLYGEPSREIAAGLPARLPVPEMPFITIAASRGCAGGWNPLIPGDDDGVVGVAEARLDGSKADFVVSGIHTFVMRDEGVVETAVDFVSGEPIRR
ncbi:MAG: alpha/beta fold hydrolase [Planctomycetota bacterium]